MGIVIQLKYQDGVFIPLMPISTLQAALQDGDTLSFKLPDPNVVYLCETDRLAALDRGEIVWEHNDDVPAENNEM